MEYKSDEEQSVQLRPIRCAAALDIPEDSIGV